LFASRPSRKLYRSSSLGCGFGNRGCDFQAWHSPGVMCRPGTLKPPDGRVADRPRPSPGRPKRYALTSWQAPRRRLCSGCVMQVALTAYCVVASMSPTSDFSSTLLLLLCYKRRVQQKGQWGSWVRRKRAILIRRVAIEAGLCRSARARRTARLEVKRKLRGA
jgi:hypothetical protein